MFSNSYLTDGSEYSPVPLLYHYFYSHITQYTINNPYYMTAVVDDTFNRVQYSNHLTDTVT